VVEFMTGRMQRLPPSARSAIDTAACLGNAFSLDTLATARSETPEVCRRTLEAPVEAGMLQRESGTVRFCHDRIQEAAYALTDPVNRAKTHLAIGRRLLQGVRDRLGVTTIELDSEPHLQGEWFQCATHQLNSASELLAGEAERRELAVLDYAAARRAKEACAYDAALMPFAKASALMPETAWQSDYDFQLALQTEWAEVAHVARDYETVEQMFALDILFTIAVPTWATNKTAAAYTQLELINISIERGVSPISAPGLVVAASVLRALWSDSEVAWELGKQGLELQRRIKTKALSPVVDFLFYNHLNYWKRPLRADR